MATMAAVLRLDSLAANLSGKLRQLLSRPPPESTPPSSSSDFSQIEEEVEKLHRRMERIRALLADAEEREMRERQIKLWLDELRDVAYDAEDVVEEFEYELLRYQLMVSEEEGNNQTTHETRGIKRRRQAGDPLCTPRPCPSLDASFQQQILDKIKEINGRFDEIYRDKNALQLSTKGGRVSDEDDVARNLPTSPLLGSSHVYGRGADRDKVTDMLLSSHGDTENVAVVSIVGMGGIGKTTLAQLVYNDASVQDHFEVKSWVCVSDCFDVLRLTKEILETLPGGTMGLQGFSPLQEMLHQNLKGKRFLLVLDDLWNESFKMWEALWSPLRGGAEGSKVLVTTRNEEVSRVSHAIGTHHLEFLSPDDSWTLFEQCAFGCMNPRGHPALVSIGKQIVKKCGGVPLAIRTLGGLLFDKTDENLWNDVLKSDSWELPEDKSDILPALKLSYHRLRPPIKPCFALCALFPKDYKFHWKDLVFFWMAQGYIKPTAARSMEDIGREYFDDLLQRSFFQEIHRFGVFMMHDLIHDLALSVWEGGCLRVVDGELSNTSRQARHLSFECEKHIIKLLSCGSTAKFPQVRTSYLVRYSSPFSFKVLDDMFQSMKYLRVLDLRRIDISELPDSLSNLKHLRYLGIRGKDLNRLPESLASLLNLQTFVFHGSYYLQELPKRLRDLVNLRHLDLYSGHLSMMPQGIGRLTQLQTLRRFVVGKGDCAAGMEELVHLNHLQGDLKIDVKSLNNWPNTEPNILSNKRGLKRLHLSFDVFDSLHESGCSMQKLEELLESIRPHTNIEEVKISGSIGNTTPKWLSDHSYSRLETLTLKKCGDIRKVLIQLPSLRRLSIVKCYKLKRVELRHLTSLRILNIEDCDKLLALDYHDVGTLQTHIPCVHSMCLKHCPKLNFLPMRQQHFPLSLWEFDFTRSSLLVSWVERYEDKLVGITRLNMDDHLVLRNVNDVEEAVAAGLSLTGCTRKLELRWDLDQHRSSWRSGEAEQVLRKLGIHRASLLQMLVIRGYQGLSFPTWVGHPDYLPLLVKMFFSDFVHCECLPPLGRLPSLRELHISNMYQVRHVGHEFCGEEWEQFGGGAFPKLEVLTISNFPKLETFQLSALQDYGNDHSLCVSGMVSSVPSSSSFNNALSLNPFPRLKMLLIKECPNLISLIGIHKISSMRVIFLRSCPTLDFPNAAQLPPQLQYANIGGCPKLSVWCQGDKISHLCQLWLDDELVFSDGRAFRTPIWERSFFSCALKAQSTNLLLQRRYSRSVFFNSSFGRKLG